MAPTGMKCLFGYKRPKSAQFYPIHFAGMVPGLLHSVRVGVYVSEGVL